jgi:hypothetical protein
MNLAACAALSRGPETGVWYRAIQPRFWQTALQTAQSKLIPSRYNEGASAIRPFEVLYLAEDHQVALLEVGAMFGPLFPPAGDGLLIPNPLQAWTILNVRVTLQRVADLTRVSEQTLISTTAQELTGDWDGYQRRMPTDSVNQPVGTAPTQALGQALFAIRGLEGFRTLSARRPARMILVVFPEKLLAGSEIEFSDGMGGTHQIRPRPKRRRRP